MAWWWWALGAYVVITFVFVMSAINLGARADERTWEEIRRLERDRAGDGS